MTTNDLTEALLQRKYIQLPTHPQRRRNVVRTAPRLQLIEEPQPLLRKRQRQPAASLYRNQRWYLLIRSTPPQLLKSRCKYTQPGRLEHTTKRNIYSEHNAHPRQHLGCQQLVTTHRKQLILAACSLLSQHLGPDPRQDLFRRRLLGFIRLLAAPLR